MGRVALVRQMPTSGTDQPRKRPEHEGASHSASTDLSCVFEESTDTRKATAERAECVPEQPAKDSHRDALGHLIVRVCLVSALYLPIR